VITLPLETERLRVRPVVPAADAVPVCELWGNPEAMRFVRPADKTVDESRDRLERIAIRSRGPWGLWALDELESGRLVGAAGLFPLAMEGPEIELAYHIVPSRWGRGYATEAGRALLDVAWRESDLDHVVAVAFEENRGSTRVMEKLGMTYEGPTKYREHDLVRYSIERPDDLDHKGG